MTIACHELAVELAQVGVTLFSRLDIQARYLSDDVDLLLFHVELADHVEHLAHEYLRLLVQLKLKRFVELGIVKQIAYLGLVRAPSEPAHCRFGADREIHFLFAVWLKRGLLRFQNAVVVKASELLRIVKLAVVLEGLFLDVLIRARGVFFLTLRHYGNGNKLRALYMMDVRWGTDS